jgi:serine protease Do
MSRPNLSHRPLSGLLPPATICALLALTVATLEACDGRTSAQKTPLPAASPPVASPSRGGAPVLSYADVVSRVTPAVVTVRSAQRLRAPRQHPFLNDPLLREFFGFDSDQAPRGGARVQYGLGSGVIVTPDGNILTNHHVIDGAEQIRVELNDNRAFDARVVGSDPPSDLAVLHIDANNLPVLRLGNSDDARVGDVVLAIGNPLSIGQTVTSGIISAKGRTTGLSDGSFESFLQTDAAINQGNSGGALVNTEGDLIGINSQILSPTGTNIGIGFAIPSNMARTVMDQLIKSGRVRRGRLGSSLAPVSPEIAERQGHREVRGVLITAVEPGGPASAAGLRDEDIVLAINGTPVNDNNSLRNLIAGSAPGSEVTLTVLRSGREQQVRARLGELQTETAGR